MAEVARRFPKITDEALADLRSRIGREVTIGERAFVEEVTADALRHWAEGIGDRNPLWTDASHAARTRWGGLIAPPSMLYACAKLATGYRGGLPGVHAFFAGTNWDWVLPIRQGDRITARCVFKDLIEHESRFAGRSFQQLSDVTYTNQRGEVVARGQPWGMRTERDTAVQRGKYERLEPATYTPQEMDEIVAAYEREEIRGATPRFWEDVDAGDELGPIVRGPYTLTTAIAFLMGYGGRFIKAHGYWYERIKKHPALAVANPQGVPEPVERVHWDSEFARHVGVPAAYDYGPERLAWLITLLTNWQGDDGFLKSLHAEVRRFNLMGDTTWCRGRVTGKETAGDETLVHCEVWSEDQRGETTARGTATVALPTREARR